MEEKFKIGDVVQLNSGSPKMTVTKIVKAGGSLGGPVYYTGKVSVAWFEGVKDFYGEFHQDALKKDEE